MTSTPKTSSLMDGLDGSGTTSSSASKARGESPIRLIGVAVLVLASLGALGWAITSAVAGARNDPGSLSRHRDLMDIKTGELFAEFAVADGENYPVENPKTGERTLMPAEKCYWTKDGGAKFEPTFVLLNSVLGKPDPTICPDCGREVVFHNPMPPDHLFVEAAKAQKK